MLSTIDKVNLLNLISELPPEEYLNEAKTFDQINHFEELKLEFYLLFNSLQKYFTGEYDEVFDTLPENKQEFYRLWRDYYLKLYNLLANCWKIIDNAAKSYEIDLPANNPGECLLRIIENDCRMMWNQCTHNTKFSPSRNYKDINEKFKLKNDSKLLLKRYDKHLKDTHYQGRLNDLQNFCIAVVMKKVTKSMPEHKYLKEFKQEVGNLNLYIKNQLHPNKKLKSHQWVNGDRYSK
jgi:hypothetical protein